MKKATAIITARGGSKGIPQKNIHPLCGKPLIVYTIEAALNCDLVNDCYVTTDNEDIKKISLEHGAKVIDRPASIAGDHSLSSDAVLHALAHLEKEAEVVDFFTLLQPTSPLRNSDHLTECLRSFWTSDCLSCVSVTEAEHHPLKMALSIDGMLKPVLDVKSLEAPRQKLPTAYRINGAIYVMASPLFVEKKSFFVEPVHPYPMSKEESLDIDTIEDLKCAEQYLLSDLT